MLAPFFPQIVDYHQSVKVKVIDNIRFVLKLNYTAIFPPIKCAGDPRVENIPCKVHVIITGITCTPEIPAKIIRKFEKS